MPPGIRLLSTGGIPEAAKLSSHAGSFVGNSAEEIIIEGEGKTRLAEGYQLNGGRRHGGRQQMYRAFPLRH